MKMLITIAWRNVWRNKGRSFVVIGSIVVGIWALISMLGFMNGFTISYVNSAIRHEISHIQIHHPAFRQDYDIRYVIPDGSRVAIKLDSLEGISAVSPRSIVQGMVSSPRKASGVRILGVSPDLERRVTGHDSLLAAGEYFAGQVRNPVVMGKELATDLKVEVGDKVVLTFQDSASNLVAGAFRVAGLLETTSPAINKSSAYVRIEDLNRILGTDNDIHEIAILADQPDRVPEIVAELRAILPDLEVESWRTIAPELELFLSMTDSMLWVLIGIIMIALVFGIINTMLMAVLERFRELGMLMAIGMNKARIFLMIVIETIFLSLVGGPIGVLAGLLTMHWLSMQGIDLSAYSDGLKEFGYSSILYPFVENKTYVIAAVGVVITALIGAIYPAYKAIRLNPTEALHTV